MEPDLTFGMACAVINDDGDLLLLKRSPSKTLFPNKWFVVGAAPLKEDDDMRKIALKEIKDELGVEGEIITEGTDLKVETEGKTWIIFPFLASVKNNEVHLNEEHTEYKWIKLNEVKNYDVVPSLPKILKRVFPYSLHEQLE